MKINDLLIAFTVCFFSFCAWPQSAGFYPLKLEPVEDTPKPFVAKGQHVSILLLSYAKDSDDKVELFPEPPLILYNQLTKSICAITEGGVWATAAIYLSANERYLLTREWSGSASDLIIYNTGNCQAVKRFNNVDERWRIHQGQLELGEKCTEGGHCSLYYPLDAIDLDTDSKSGK